jgi:hypothetical protein
LSLTYGLPVQRRHDPLVLHTEHTFNEVQASAAPGKYIVDIIPALQHVPGWVPGAGFQKVAAGIREKFYKVMEQPFEATLKETVCSSLQLAMASSIFILVKEK